MIIAEVFYGVKCDRCGTVYDGADSEYYSDMDSALSYAKEDEWIERAKMHYCPNCYVIDKDTEAIRIKPPRSKHVKSLEKFINEFLGHNARVLEGGDYYEVLFYGKALCILDEEYIRKMLGSNLLSLEYNANKYMYLSECVIKIKK